MPTSCPKCGSTDTQAVRMIVAAGTSRHSGRAEHVVNTRRGPVAIGESEHSGVAMTELARRFQAPVTPQRDLRIPLAGVVLLFPGILMVYNVLAQSSELALWEVLRRLGFGLIPIVLGGGLLYLFQGGDAVHQEKQRAWQERVDYLKNAWLCYSCGHDWRADS